MELFKAIKLIRTASGMKQKDVAAKLGVTSNYISLLEHGKREPSISFLKRLGKLLGVPVGLFFLWDYQGSREGIDQVRDLLAKLEALYLLSQPGRTRKRRAVA